MVECDWWESVEGSLWKLRKGDSDEDFREAWPLSGTGRRPRWRAVADPVLCARSPPAAEDRGGPVASVEFAL